MTACAEENKMYYTADAFSDSDWVTLLRPRRNDPSSLSESRRYP